MTRNQRLSFALDQSRIGQTGLSEELGTSASNISKRLRGDEIDSLDFIRAVSRLTGYAFEWLADGTGPERESDDVAFMGVNDADNAEYLSGKVVRPITVTVDKSGRELITYVQVKAYAGYKRGFGDPNFIEKLPAFNLPNLPQGKTFRMFEADGDSMLQLGGGGLHDGDAVIGEYVEDIFSLKDNRVYIVVTTDGVLIKRVINRLTSDEKILVLTSDNKNGQYPNIIIHPREILEVWEFKALISRQLSFHTDLYQLINDLQVEQALIRAKVNEVARGTNVKELPAQDESKNKRIG